MARDFHTRPDMNRASLTMLATETQETDKWGLSTLGWADGMTTRKFQRAGIERIKTT